MWGTKNSQQNPYNYTKFGIKNLLLKNFTTIQTGGEAKHIVMPETEQELTQAVQDLGAQKTSFLMLGQGSNMLLADSGYPGTVVHPKTSGYKIVENTAQYQLLETEAGNNFDDFILQTVQNNLSGLEMLSGIPGLVGATPIQNVGAYGCEVSEAIHSVRCWDRQTQQIVVFSNSELKFSYRNSLLKVHKFRYVVLQVTFKLYKTKISKPIQYQQLAKQLAVAVGGQRLVREVREAVLFLRKSKGMVIDLADRDTYSLGSFFVNPVVEFGFAQKLGSTVPRFLQKNGMAKLSAAWLIENSGFGKGYGIVGAGFALTQGRVSLSTKHVLAITNRGNATTEDVLGLARVVRAGVLASFGVLLLAEPVLVDCSI